MISAATGGSDGKPAPPLPGAPGGGGGPPPKLTSRITGTGLVDAAGVYNVSLICGASGPLPIDPVIFFITAAPSRACASVSVTCHVTAGVFAGRRP